ncbi:MAG: hypothetical protein FWD94_07365 [Treponema sp.]|nr:hypothetical protein [Treponema sp.]
MASPMNRTFSYRYGTSPLHRCPAGIKLPVLFLLGSLTFLGPFFLGLSLLALLAVSVVAGVPLRQLLAIPKPLLVLTVFIILVRAFDPEGSVAIPGTVLFGRTFPAREIPFVSSAGLFAGFVAAVRVVATFALAGLFFAVTTMRELRLSLAGAELRLRGKKSGTAYAGLGLSLMLGFVPRFFQVWEAANLACDARSGKRGLRRLPLLLPLVTERMMEAAADTVLALEARGILYRE